MIRFNTLGTLDLRLADGREAREVLAQPKLTALLAYLAIAAPAGFHRRDKLLALLWPELDDARARNALSKGLYALRHVLGEQSIVGRSIEEVGLGPDQVWCDATAFEAALDDGRVEDALALYRGDLLDGFFVSGAPEFERWLERERTGRRQRAVAAALSLAEAAAIDQRFADALRWTERAMALDPANEVPVQRRMQALDAAGDRAGALQVYREVTERLAAEYEVEPSPETVAMAQAIRDRRSVTAPANPSVSVPAAAPPRRDLRRRSLLLGSVAAVWLIAMAVWLAPHLTSRALLSAAPTARQVTFTGDVQHAALSPDGRYLALVRGTDSGPRAFVREAEEAGADAVPLAGGIAANEVAWISDGSEIIVRAVDRRSQLIEYLRTPLLGGPARAVGGRGFHQSLSPDGRRVAGWYVSHKAIALRTVASGDSVDVSVPGEYTWLSHVTWSPDSRRLAVLVSWDDGPLNRLLIVDPTGRDPPSELLRDSVRIVTPVWSPRGDAIYYLRERTGVWDLWKLGVSPATGEPDRVPVLVAPALEVGLTHPGDGAELNAFSVSADGSLLYVRERVRVNLVLMELDETGRTYRHVRDLTTGTSIKGPPAISPNGTWVAFTDGDRVRRDVYLMPLDGGTPTRLTSLGTATSAVAWSPTGDRVAFASVESGRATVSWVSTNGTTSRRYPDSRVGTEPKALAWSPGDEILYQRPGNRSWHRLDPSTGADVALVSYDSAGWMFDAAVSPDGGTVAVRWNLRPPGIWLITRANGATRFLIGGEYYYYLGWEPDGTALRVVSEQTGGVMRVAPNGRVLGPAPSVPEECDEAPATLDFRRMVCLHVVRESDAWILEEFDPEVRRRPE